MKNITKILFSLLLFSVIAAAQKPKTAPKTPPPIVPVKTIAPPVEQGAVSGKTYTNRAYNFQMTFPADWAIPENYLDENIQERGYELKAAAPSNGSAKTPAQIAGDIDRVKVLLTAYHSGSGAGSKTLLRVSVEDLSPLPQIADAVDYFDAMRQSFKTMKLPADFKFSETQAEQLGAKQFAFLDTSSNAGKKRMYATVRQGYALMFTLTYKSADDLEAFRSILTKSDFRLE